MFLNQEYIYFQFYFLHHQKKTAGVGELLVLQNLKANRAAISWKFNIKGGKKPLSLPTFAPYYGYIRDKLKCFN